MREFLRYLFVVATMLMVVVGDVWGQTYNDGVWYSLYNAGEFEINTVGSKEYSVFAPTNGTISFNWYYNGVLGSRSHETKIYESNNNGGSYTHKGTVSGRNTNWPSASISVSKNINKIKFARETGNTWTAEYKNVKLSLAKHILLESGVFGASSVTVTDGNLATAEGYTSTNAYKIKLRSFLASGNIKMTSSNPEFHFGGGVTEISLGVANNYCASANGSGTCTSASVLGQISNYFKDVYFSPSVQYNANARSTTITITDGVNTAYVYLSAPVIPTYYFKAEAIAYLPDGGTATADFEGTGKNTYSLVASGVNAASASADVTFTASAANANYVYEGWKMNSTDASFYKQGAGTESFVETVTSSALNPNNLTSQLTYYAIYSQRYTATITGSNFENKKVGESFTADYNFVNSQTARPSASSADPFYYVISHDFSGNDSRDDSPRPNEVIAYDAATNTITPLNEGRATITFYQKNTSTHDPVSNSFTVDVIKHQPEFKWHGQAANVSTVEYFNNPYADFFTSLSTTNNASLNLMYESSDVDVALLSDGSDAQKLNLTTFNKETSTTLTVTQKENYYWYEKTETKVVKPVDPNNHVPFVINSSEKMWTVFYNYHNKDLGWDNGLKFSNNDDIGFDWEDNYLIIKFTGVPDKLSFYTKTDGTATTGTNSDLYFYVAAGDKPDNLTEIWQSKEKNNGNATQKISLSLNPDVHYIKLCYTGNLDGWFYDVEVTELEEFHAVDKSNDAVEVEHLYFDRNQVYTDKPLNFDLKYANAGYKVKVESNDSRFKVNPTSINTIGGCKFGKETITVTYRSEVPYETTGDNSYIVISDELAELNGHRDTVFLHASSYQPTQGIEWRADFAEAEKPTVRVKDGQITDAATATSGLPVIYTSSDTTVIAVRNEGRVLLPKADGEALITASQAGNETWQPARSISKTFVVTDKIIQYIVWLDDLTDLIVGGNNVNLTAKVYLQNEETKTWEEHPELTEKLVYSVNDTRVVSVNGNVLSIVGVGTAIATVTAPGNTDYATATLTKPVRVRSASAGCEDVLLLNHRDEVRFFAYNLDQIVQGEFAINHTKGVPGTLSFQHSGASWDLGIQYYAGKIRAEYNTTDDSNWVLAKEVTPTEDQTNLEFDIPLPRNASKIRFVRPEGGQGYHYVSNIQVHPAQYIESVDTINFGEIHVGSKEDTTFVVNYSNIKDKVYLGTSNINGEITTNPTEFGEECGEFGSKTITVTWTPATVDGNALEIVTLRDDVSETTCEVVLKAKVIPGTQNLFWVDKPDAISNCNTIDFPEQTTAHIDINWEVVEGKDVADFNDKGELVLYKQGTIRVRAYNAGNANYYPFEDIYTFTINYDPIFLGTVGDKDWKNIDNWNICRLPNENDIVTIKAEVELDTTVVVKGLKFADAGNIHIADSVGMTIGSYGLELTSDGLITIDNTPEGAGFLKVDPSATNMPKGNVTINYATTAYNSGNPRDEIWQYMGAPGTGMDIVEDVEKTLIYHWSEQKGWEKQNDEQLTPFAGYVFTQNKGTKDEVAEFNITAVPIIADQTINLTCTPNGMRGGNVFANSYLAPIDVAKIDPDDIEGIEPAFYLFNSGSWNQWQNQGGSVNKFWGDGTSPGQYYAITPGSASMIDASIDQTTIPPMQGVYVMANKNGAQIKLDYAKHVYRAEASNRPMRAPEMRDENFKRVRLQVNSQNSGADRMYVIQHEDATKGYDYGYDAKNIAAEDQVNIYTSEQGGQMEISVSNRIDSTYIGFQAGSDSEYCLRITSVVGEKLLLKDLETETVVAVEDEVEYTFSATPKSVNNKRFLLIDQLAGEEIEDLVKVYIYDNVVHVLEAPKDSDMAVYSAGGLMMARYALGEAPCTVELSGLPTGVYLVRIADKAVKFVCK